MTLWSDDRQRWVTITEEGGRFVARYYAGAATPDAYSRCRSLEAACDYARIKLSDEPPGPPDIIRHRPPRRPA